MRALVAAVFVLLTSAACSGQTDTGTILGLVTDQGGGLLPGAKIVIENQGTALNQTLTTDSSGGFTSTPLAVGTYTVSVSAAGFETEIRSGLTLQVSDRMRLVIALRPGDVKQTVVVTGQTPLIDSASTTLGGVVNKEQVADLPVNGRSVTSLLALVPGVELRGGSNQLSVGGQGTFTNEGGLHFLLDGGDASRVDFDDVNNTYGSSAGRVSRASVDAVEEFRVYTDSYSAEYGQTQGGVINLITKSGTNTFHGSLFEYFRNEILDARDYFNPAPAYKPAYRLNQFGGTFGGPIVHNKLFFFTDYEGIRQRSGNILLAVVPTAAARAAAVAAMQPAFALLPLPNGAISTSDPRFGNYTEGVSNPLNENTGLVKIDWNMSPSDHLVGRYNINQNQTNTYFGVATGQVQSAPGFMQLAMVGYTHTFTPQILNEANFYFNRFHVDPRASDNAAVLSFPIINFGEGAGVGPGLFDLHVANNSFTYQDNLTWVHGRQQIKIGGGAIRNQANKLLGFQMTVNYLTFSDALANQAYSDGTLGNPRAGMRNTYYHLFIQDNVQLSQRVSLNMGLRYQYDTAPTEALGRIANFNFSTGALDPAGSSVLNAPKLNFAPRFGIAYSPFANGNTVLRGGFGLFFSDLNAGNLAQNLPGNLPGFGQAASVTDLQVPGLVGLPFPDLKAFAVPTKSFSAIVKNYQEPYAEKWNFNIQRALGHSAVVQLGYNGARGLHLIESYDANRLFPGGASRPYPQYGSIGTDTTSAISNYDAFQATFHKRWNNGLTFNGSYTLSHSLDDAPTVFGSYQDDHNPLADYGNSDFDVRHNLELDASYAIPDIPAVPKLIGSGWQFNDITAIRSGFPYDVTCGCDPLDVGQSSSRADKVPGVSAKPTNFSIPANQLNLEAFATPVGHFGTLGRNVFYGPDAVNFDMSLFKNIKITEKQQLVFRTEFFNIFNHPQFSNPNAALNNIPQFGQTTSTLSTLEGFHTNRQIQFALRYSF
jgi:Carboxypeptidase regulatory-like domain/TonB-dependent Receptor Plug Domain/TonB dependent receptor